MIARSVRGLAAATLLVVAVAATADAQKAAPSRFSLSAGISMPIGDFKDAANMGFLIGGSFNAYTGEAIQLRLNVDYARNGFSDAVVALAGDGNWSLLGVMANVVYPFKGNSAGFYVLGGLGFYQLDASVSGATSESDMAYNVGAGMGKGKWFGEVRYQSIQADPALTSIPIVFGMRF